MAATTQKKAVKQRIRVYWNSNKGCYSIQGKKPNGWRVIGHASNKDCGIHLSDVDFHVSQKGRERVLRTKQKNVHAWVEGVLLENLYAPIDVPISWTWATYNPYKNETFMSATGKPVLYRQQAIVCTGDGKPYIYVEDT